MKIHIVQKGDTLWEISKKYEVDFEQLKQTNSHIASPDMIMPGMKIKIPSTTKNVKKEGVIKEKKVKETKQPYKDFSPKPMPVIKEDDNEKQKVVKPEMPTPPMPSQPIMQMPIMQMPILDQDFEFNFPVMPSYTEKKEEKKEKVKEEKKVVEQQPVYQAPVQEQPVYQPPVQEPMLPIMHHPMPHYPCCYYVHPCFPPFHYPMAMPDYTHHAYPASPTSGDCGCGAQQFIPAHPMAGGLGFYPAPNQQPIINPPMTGPMFDSPGQTPIPQIYPDFSSMYRKENDDKKSEEE